MTQSRAAYVGMIILTGENDAVQSSAAYVWMIILTGETYAE